MKKISCIIPAFNEEKNIWKNIEILENFLWKEIFEIIVVNDCSSDKTWKILEKFNKIKIITNTKNLWKSASVAKAVKNASWDFIFLLDADLINLTKENILNFVKPILEEKSEVVMAFFKNSIPLFPFKKIDYCSGQRIFPKKFLEKNMKNLEKITSYWLEVFLNKIFIQEKTKIKIIKWQNVENDFHHKKDWFFAWWKRNLKIWKNILKNWWGIIWIYKMNFDLEKLLEKKSRK